MAQVDARSRLGNYWPILGGPVTSSVLLAGVFILLLGAALQTGVWAGMFGILGTLLILVAVVSRALIVLYEKL